MVNYLVLGWMLVNSVGAAAAETLVDPTRPPSSMSEKPLQASAPSSVNSGLQSIFISRHRRIAMIDGKEVPVGGHVGDAKLVQIAEDHVVLKDAKGTRTIALLPGIEKRPPLSTVATPGGKKPGHVEKRRHDVQ